jgi:integrase/recombinase XerD
MNQITKQRVSQLEATLDPAGRLAWRDFTRDLRAAGCPATTPQNYLYAAAQLRQMFPGTPLLAMTRAQISDYLITLADTGRASSTVVTRYAALRRFYTWCLAEEILTTSPMARIPAPKLASTVTPVLRTGILQQLLKTCAGKTFNDRRDTAMIRLWCEAGSPRCSEMIGLTLDCVDLDGDQVLIRRGKGGKDRLIILSPATARALSRYLRTRISHRDAASPQVWLGRQGPLSGQGARDMLQLRCAQAGLPKIHPHQLRHTATARFYAAGGTERSAMRLFGWSTEKMAHHYGEAAATQLALDTARTIALGDQL